MLLVTKVLTLTKAKEAELEVAEWKILMIYLGVSRMGRIINEYIRGTDQGEFLGRKIEKQG